MNNLIEAVLRYLPPSLVVPLLILAIALGSVFALINFYYSNEIEASKQYRERQLEILFGAAEVVPDLAYARDEEGWAKAKVEFWRYYAGKLVLVENNAVCTAMAELGKRLKRTDFSKRSDLSSLVLDVSKALRSQITSLQDSNFSAPLEKIVSGSSDEIRCLG